MGLWLILLTWVLLLAGFAGIGAIPARLAGLPPKTLPDWFTAFWVGWALSLAFLQVWHFAFPVNEAARLILGGVAVAGLAWMVFFPTAGSNRWPLPCLPHHDGEGETLRGRRRWGLLLLLITLIFTLIIANKSTLAPDNTYDTGVYHLNAVRWMAEYPVLPGLGNLHSRLAFSNGYFLYPALLDAGIWAGRTYHLANGLLFWVLFLGIVAQIITSHRQVNGQSGRTEARAYETVVISRDRACPVRRTRLQNFSLIGDRPPQINPFAGARHAWPLREYTLVFQGLFLPVVLFIVLANGAVPGVANDPPLFVLGVVVAGMVLNMGTGSKNPAYDLFVIVLLACIGVAIKFSFAIFGAGYVLVALVIYAGAGGLHRRAGGLIMIGLLILLPMVARSLIETGYPLYPLQIGALAVDWRIDPAYATLETNFIRSTGRIIGAPIAETLNGWGWLSTWAGNALREYYHFTLPVGLMGVCVILLIIVRTGHALSLQRPMLFFIPPLAAILFWFFSAPSIRFASVSFWILALGLAAMVITRMESPQWRRAMFFGVLVILLLPGLRLFALNPWVTPADGTYGLHPVKSAELEIFTTDSGLEVLTPASGNQCWDAPLPCTPYPHPNLRLRHPDDMARGFILEIGPDDPPQIID